MPTNSPDPPKPARSLPDRPNLRHLKDQAKDLFKSGQAESLTNAQFKVAREYGFASWQKLRDHVNSLEEIGQLKQAIDSNDLEARARSHDSQSRIASRSSWLQQKWTTHVGS